MQGLPATIEQHASHGRRQDCAHAADADPPTHAGGAYRCVIDHRRQGIQPSHAAVGKQPDQQAQRQRRSDRRAIGHEQHQQRGGNEHEQRQHARQWPARSQAADQRRAKDAAHAQQHPAGDALLGRQAGGHQQFRRPAHDEVEAEHDQEEQQPDHQRGAAHGRRQQLLETAAGTFCPCGNSRQLRQCRLAEAHGQAVDPGQRIGRPACQQKVQRLWQPQQY